MPQLQNLVLTDRAATPVQHTFVPRDILNGVATVVNSDGTPVGEKRYSISSRRVNGKIKTRVVFAFPVVQTETINGISKPKVVRESIVDATFTFAGDSSESERNNAVGMFADSLAPAKVLVNDALVKAQGVY